MEPNVEHELNRILNTSTPNPLLQQLKDVEQYQSKIEIELSNKSQQIMDLQKYIQEEIKYLEHIALENQVLKGECERMRRLEEKRSQKEAKDFGCQAEKYGVDWNGQTQQQVQINEVNMDQVIFLKQQVDELIKEKLHMQRRLDKSESVCASPSPSISQQPLPTTCSQILARLFNQTLPQLKFSGQLLSNKKHSKGTLHYTHSTTYTGNFCQNKLQGIGSLHINNNLIYRGQWKNNKFEGKGKQYFYQSEGQREDIESYEGMFRDGKWEGYGCARMKNGAAVIGKWEAGRMVGEGVVERNGVRKFGRDTALLINK